MSNKLEATFHGATVDVVCAGCGQLITIALVGETLCACGVRHTHAAPISMCGILVPGTWIRCVRPSGHTHGHAATAAPAGWATRA